jgi:hypothetical protein
MERALGPTPDRSAGQADAEAVTGAPPIAATIVTRMGGDTDDDSGRRHTPAGD